MRSPAATARPGSVWSEAAPRPFTLAPLGADLYDGVGGIALFLAVLGRAIAEDRFLVLGEKAARYVRAELEGGRTRNHVGGFIGVPSQLYAVAHVAAILGDDCGLREMMRVALDRLSAGLAESGESDVIYGAAGAILALLALGRPAGSLLPHLLACLEILERTARPFADGLAWPSPGGRPLLGFSHGNAGIACALVRLAAALEGVDHPARERCRKLAVSARRYERARFDPDRRNWPDFRGSEPDGRDQVSWCHGAPGVVLARLPLADEDCLSEIELGMETILEPGRQSRHTLCHGEVGNLVIAAHVAERLARDDWRRCVAGRLPGLLDAIAARPKVDSAFCRSGARAHDRAGRGRLRTHRPRPSHRRAARPRSRADIPLMVHRPLCWLCAELSTVTAKLIR